MAELGRAALAVTLGLSAYALVAGGYAAYRGRRRLAASARNALIAAFGSTLVATLVLVVGFLRDDFSLAYVTDHSSRALPIPYKISALWGGQEGSLLLWLLILTGYAALAVSIARRRAPDLVAWTTPVLGAICVGFAWLLVGVSSPFEVVAWTALGIGQLLGAHWAYQEVGWGGYYAWDPVENAALMPWLVATAFLHSVMIQEKRGMLKVWNMALVSGAFCLSLFGTFLTRSGVVSSIHSFTQSSIGPWFLAFIIVTVVFSVTMIWLRLPQLRATTRLESLVSREAVFLYNNLLLVALALTILWGTAWPIVSEAVRGESVVVGRPYYDFFLRIFGLPLLLLMGIGPLIAWRRASLRGLGRVFAWPAAVSLAVGLILVVLGAGSSIPGLIAYTFSAFVLVTIAQEFWRGTAARRALTGEPVPRAFGRLVSRSRRRYGGYVVHASVVLLAIGIAGSSAYDSVAEGRLARGESLEVGGYTLTYRGVSERQAANALEVRASLDVSRNGSDLGTLEAGKNAYAVEQQVSNEVGIRSDLLTGEDLFVIAEQVNDDGSVVFRVFVKPLVNLIWLAGLVFLLGSVIALWPDAREERRLAARYARVTGQAETSAAP
jgi:cytochrome c-type biogenesis protein CcmF